MVKAGGEVQSLRLHEQLRLRGHRRGRGRGSRPERGGPRIRRRLTRSVRRTGPAVAVLGLRAGHLAGDAGADARAPACASIARACCCTRQQWSPRLGAAFAASPRTTLRASLEPLLPAAAARVPAARVVAERRGRCRRSSTSDGGRRAAAPTSSPSGSGRSKPASSTGSAAACASTSPTGSVTSTSTPIRTCSSGPRSSSRTPSPKGRARGVDARLEFAPGGAWSGYGNVSIGTVTQTGPITGGLFLEDDVADHRARRRVHARSRSAGRGLGGADVDRAARRHAVGRRPLRERHAAPARRRRRGRGARGASRRRSRRLRPRPREPRTLVSLLASAAALADRGRRRSACAASVLNLFDARYAYNFGNPFSGTHFGAPRTASVTVRVETRCSGCRRDADSRVRCPTRHHDDWHSQHSVASATGAAVTCPTHGQTQSRRRHRPGGRARMRRDPAGPTQGPEPPAPPPGKANWPTDGYDVQRTSWQRHETLISPASVKGMKLVWKLKLDNAAAPAPQPVPADDRQRRADGERAEADRRRRRRLRQPLRHRPRHRHAALEAARSTTRSPSRPTAARLHAVSRRADRDAGHRARQRSPGSSSSTRSRGTAGCGSSTSPPARTPRRRSCSCRRTASRTA